LNAVLESSEGLLKAAASQAEDLATKYERFNASTKNLSDTIKKELAISVTNIIPDFDDLVDTYSKVIAIQDEFDVRRPLFRSHFVKDGEVIAKTDAELIKWAESQREAAKAIEKTVQIMEEEAGLHREIAYGMEEQEGASEELTDATEDLRKEQEKLIQVRVDESFRNLKDLMKVDLTESFVEFQGKVRDLRGEISTLEGMDYLTEDQKNQLEESRDELDKTIKKWREYTSQVIFNIAAQALEREGLTEEEAIALAKSAEGLGLVDEGYAALTESIYESADSLDYIGDQSDEFAGAMQRLVESLSDATLEADNLDEAIRRIPTAKTVTIRTSYGIHKRQYGGDVERGLPYLVGEKGPELFIPDISGNVLSNMMTKAMGQVSSSVTNTNTSYGDNLNLHIHTSAPTENVVADFRMLKAMGSRV